MYGRRKNNYLKITIRVKLTYYIYKLLNTKSFLLITIFALILGCSSPNEETPIIEEKHEQTDIIDGPVANACPDIEYPDWKTSPYVLPYPVGESYKIDLSNCMGYYHGEGKPDQFAIDFNMPIGSLITAARAGKVVWVVENGEDGSNPNNLVVVDHGDKTFAQYMHLTKDGALVKVGDKVKMGDEIGLSGNTGLAGYPHLHFVVTSNFWSWPYKSIPVTFCNTLSNIKSLASGTKYKAFEY